MINDIKLSTSGSPVMPQCEATPSSADCAATQTDAVTVHPHLGKLADALTEGTIDEDRGIHLASIKNLVANGEYRLDMKALTRNLASNPLITQGI